MPLSAQAFFLSASVPHIHTRRHTQVHNHMAFLSWWQWGQSRERHRQRGGRHKKVLGLEGVDSVPLFFLWSWHFQLFPELMCAWLVCFGNCRVTAKLLVWPRRKGTGTVAKVLCAADCSGPSSTRKWSDGKPTPHSICISLTSLVQPGNKSQMHKAGFLLIYFQQTVMQVNACSTCVAQSPLR